MIPNIDEDKYDNIPNRILKKEVAHAGECTSIASNHNGEILATAGNDQCIKIWNFKKA